MAKKRLNPLVKRSRTRSGCLTCRDRHMKCDEHQPVCKNCLKSKRKCYRGIRLNFTQYTYFNPKEHEPNLPPSNPDQYRILDQSITIASLYKHGRRRYGSYLHLHSDADLFEADRRYNESAAAAAQATIDPSQGTALATPTVIAPDDVPDPIPNPQSPSLTPYPQGYMTHFPPGAGPLDAPGVFPQIQESYDISSYLLKPSPQYAPPPAPPSMLPQEVSEFIDVVERHQYHWFLDLFNELSTWGSMVPHRCFTPDYHSSFLNQALLINAHPDMVHIDPVIAAQVQIYSELSRLAVPPPTRNYSSIADDIQRQIDHHNSTKGWSLRVMELVVSIALILVAVLQRDHLDIYFRMVAYNQGRLYDAIAGHVAEITTRNDTGSNDIVWASAVQSVTILKYFITKRYNAGPLAPPPPIMEPPLTSMMETPPSSSLFMLNPFELGELNSGFARAQFSQLNHHYRSDGSVGLSDSLKLRELVWHLIKLDYVRHNSGEQLRVELAEPMALRIAINGDTPMSRRDDSRSVTPLVQANLFDMPPVSRVDEYYPPPSILANPRGVAINLLREHVLAITNSHDPHLVRQCRYRTQFIFRIIHESGADDDTKNRWQGFFGWTNS